MKSTGEHFRKSRPVEHCGHEGTGFGRASAVTEPVMLNLRGTVTCGLPPFFFVICPNLSTPYHRSRSDQAKSSARPPASHSVPNQLEPVPNWDSRSGIISQCIRSLCICIVRYRRYEPTLEKLLFLRKDIIRLVSFDGYAVVFLFIASRRAIALTRHRHAALHNGRCLSLSS